MTRMPAAMRLAPVLGAIVFACSARVVGATPPAPTPPPSGAVPEGFRLEPKPAFDDVFGDIDTFRKTVDRFVAVADLMQHDRDEFTRAVQSALTRLQPPVDGSKPKRGCPEADVAPPYARALELGGEYLHAGRELTSHFEQIRELDRLGETVGLTPDYRLKVKRAMAQYQALLTDYREMKVAFHDQLTDELRYAGCDLDRLLAHEKSSAHEEAWPQPGDPGAPGVPPLDKNQTLTSSTDNGLGTLPREPPHEGPPAPRSGIFIFIDNTRCPTGTHVSLDGKAVSDVPGQTRAALETTPGPHDLCLVPDGSNRKCGDAGTLRRSYLHDGWTISLRCK